MPLFSFANDTNDDAPQELSADEPSVKRSRRPSLLRKNPLRAIRRHLVHAETVEEKEIAAPQTAPPEITDIPDYFFARRPSLPGEVTYKRAVPSLPPPQTFRRQQSEKRDRLLPLDTSASERRAVSVDRRRSRETSADARGRSQSSKAVPLPSISAHNVALASDNAPSRLNSPAAPENGSKTDLRINPLPSDMPTGGDAAPMTIGENREKFLETKSLQEEYDRRWILNLSMQFRDRSNREKFFVTYAERPNKWRRLTVSLDYRNAPEESLEADLSTLVYQRDKSLRVYEAIRESLPDIQYYDTVTNLKLETTPEDGQLHVHVREDANEIIDYPAISLFDHVQQPRFNESSILLESHLSGFVYKVRLGRRLLIKKEIPGPDTVDEFMYEINALDALVGCDHVVQLEGLVVDDHGEVVKGLLLSYASHGAMVDMIFDFRGTSSLPWHRREKWAKQIVSGLADIHEAGFVQGDFTLSNIVIDEDDNALIIDINRRGCPVGWEPPELVKFIDSGQRISMCIGAKTDLFQLGMVLWALAEEVDEPERVERPLPPVFDDIPTYYSSIVQTCLRQRPQGRASAKELLRQFPSSAGLPLTGRETSFESGSDLEIFSEQKASSSIHRSDRQYIDPDMAVTIDDVKQSRRPDCDAAPFESDLVTYLNPESNPGLTTYPFASSASWILEKRSRGRSPCSSGRRRRCSPYERSLSSATSVSADEAQAPPSTCSDMIEKEPSSTIRTDDVSPALPSFPPSTERLEASAPVETIRIPFSVDLQHTDSGFAQTMNRTESCNGDHLLDAADGRRSPVMSERRSAAGDAAISLTNGDAQPRDRLVSKTERPHGNEITKTMSNDTSNASANDQDTLKPMMMEAKDDSRDDG